MASARRRRDPHSKLARLLAHNDKAVRDATVEKLGLWLSRRAVVTEMDMLKVWKGLFYCFWMSDKRPVQSELASKIAKFIGEMEPERAEQYLKASFDTLAREWTKIDQLRMDKFMMLARKICFEAISYMQARDWAPGTVRALVKVMSSAVFEVNNRAKRGICLHCAELFLDEVDRVLVLRPSPPLKFDTLLLLLAPFWDLLRFDSDDSYTRVVNEEIVDRLIALSTADDNDAPAPGLSAVVSGRNGDLAVLMMKLAFHPKTSEKNRSGLYGLRERVLKETGLPEEDEPDLDTVRLPPSFFTPKAGAVAKPKPGPGDAKIKSKANRESGAKPSRKRARERGAVDAKKKKKERRKSASKTSASKTSAKKGSKGKRSTSKRKKRN